MMIEEEPFNFFILRGETQFVLWYKTRDSNKMYPKYVL